MTMEDGANNLSELIDYQDGAVVSRQLAKTSGGSVTVFAFAEGEGLSEHTTPHEALLQIVDGVALIEIAGVTHQVGEGQIIHLPGGVPHAVQAEQRFKMLLMMVRSES
ncbi:MAG: cupin domain-containing protein [Gemmatimonadetes bacterium]|nr:cupin domain-containing protein [Gemmatimonadota bacterium]NNK48279.1 cupin domain-containing protein [Gemmatimonadota bacterium]